MQKIPLAKIPNQKIRVVLDNQNCTIHLYQRGRYFYLDLMVDAQTVAQGALCQVNTSLLQYKNIYFSGVLFFIDKTGYAGDLDYREFNDRFILVFHPKI